MRQSPAIAKDRIAMLTIPLEIVYLQSVAARSTTARSMKSPPPPRLQKGSRMSFFLLVLTVGDDPTNLMRMGQLQLTHIFHVC